MQRPDYSTHTDQFLLQQLSQSDQAAFAAIYQRYWNSLYREAMNVLRAQKEAEDCVQEIFISLWKRRDSIAVNTSLKAYLQTAVRYKCIDHIERNMIRGGYLRDFAAFQASLQTEPSIEYHLYAREMAATIESLMQKMPEKMREIYRLSRQEQLTHREIARRLNISEETVKKQIYLALKQLRSHLGDGALATLICFAFINQ
jgi:RNA polymerase sigma-70 factor, Bacteroides expansion family 1